jgi:uncharacterized protein YcbK (DUF882 family)
MIEPSKGPSQHLSWKELACKDGTPYPDDFVRDGRCGKLAIMFENIRSLYGKPIIVLSAYRTKAHNKRVNGAPNSQHLHGRALDLKPPEGITLDRFYKDIKHFAQIFGIHGIGKYQTFIHVDIRPIERIAYWNGIGVKDS